MTITPSHEPTVELRGIRKSYGHVDALRGVDLTVHPGQVTALVGDNGAGKSTAVKVLSGVIAPDGGEMRVDGVAERFTSPLEARASGIETVYQDLALAADLDPAANLFLGRETLRSGPLGRWFRFLDFAAMERETEERLRELRIELGPGARRAVDALSGGQRQAVAIARATSWSRKLLILDEPTAALGVQQTEVVFDLVRRMRDRGQAVLVVLHNIPQVFEIADRIAVLRLGQTVGEFATGDTSMGEVVGLMTGVQVGAHATGEDRLEH
jgi:ABC-type sugar transport system ATPase subunit